MRKLFFLLVLTAVTTLACQALTVNVTPGKLAQIVDDDVDITELVINGSMDARDFLFITENLNHLTVLDLSQVTIVPFNKSVPVYGTYIDYLGNEIPRTAFFGKPLTSVILPAGIEGIGYAAFAGCDQLRSIELPASVTYLEDYAFAGSGLTNIELPSTVRWMGDGVFSRCIALTRATVNSDEIGRFAFLGDSVLNALTIGNNVKVINEGAFNGCTALTTIKFAAKSQLSRIGDEAFINSGLQDINIKTLGVTSIGDWALSQTRLTSIALTDGLNHIGDGALAHNPYLAYAELPDMGKVNTTSSKWDTNSTDNPTGDNTGVISPKRASARIKPTLEVIGAYTFADDSLLNVSHLLKTGVQTIEPYAFYNNSLEMDTMFLPSTIVFLGDSAMAGMTGMRVLNTAAEDVPELGIGVWAGVDQPSIPLITPDNEATALYKEADQWMNFFFAPDFLKGDVNNDGLVNIADVTALIDHILDSTYPVNELAADFDEDGVIGVSDVTAITDYILHANKAMSLKQIKDEIEKTFDKTNDALTIEASTMQADMTRTIDVALNNEENSYHAMQCDLVLPRGMQLTAVESVNRGKNHISYTIKHDEEDNVFTLMNVSMDNHLYAGNEGKVLRLTLTADDNFDASTAEMRLTNVMLVDTKNHIHHAADVMSQFNENTAVEKVNADKQIAKVTYVNVAGQQSEEPFDGMNIVVTTYTDGTTSTVKVIK